MTKANRMIAGGGVGMTRRSFAQRLALAAAAGLAPQLACGSCKKTDRRPAQQPTGEGTPLPTEDGAMYDAVIVGGGLSGLVTAYLAKDQNILLLEKEKELGGRIRTGEWEGLRYSLGASYIGKPTGDMKEWFDTLGVKAVPVPPPSGAFAYEGKVLPDAEWFKLLKKRGACRDLHRVGLELAKLADEGIEDAVYGDIGALGKYEELDRYSVAAWLDRQKVHPLVRLFIDVENRGLFGASNRDISFLFDVAEMGWNIHEEGLDEYCDADSDEIDPEDLEEEHDDALYTFPNGMIEIVWQIENRLGANLQRGATVTEVAVDDDRRVTISFEQGGGRHQVHARAAVLATPAPVTARIVKRGFSPAVMKALASIDYTSYVTMVLFLSERVHHSAWNLCCLDTCFTTLNDAIRTQMPVDYRGKAVLGVALPPMRAAEGKALIARADDDLLAMVLADIERYFPGFTKKLLGSRVNRFEYAFPVFRPGYGQVLAALHDDRSTRGPLVLAGDHMFYPTLGGAAASGMAAFEILSERVGANPR